MFAYIVRRILQAIAVVFVISIVVFILVRCLPGDPIEMYVSQAGLTEITPEMIEEIRHDKGLDGRGSYSMWTGLDRCSGVTSACP